MNSLVLPFAILCVLALAAVALSSAALFFVRTLCRSACRESDERAQKAQAKFESEIQTLRAGLDGLSAQLREGQQSPAVMAAPPSPRPGFNLSKRSQALRMRRTGASVEQITAALDVSSQEVELLIKVHRIVIGAI
jgi:hypothetical protein